MDSTDIRLTSQQLLLASDVWAPLHRLHRFGSTVSPRGQVVRELENFSHTFLPWARYSSFAARKFKVDYLKREFQWYLAGSNDDDRIDRYAKTWADIRARGQVNSNYGQYLFRDRQLMYVIDQLKADPDSRRASVVILQPQHLRLNSADTPCTYSMNFRIRDGFLKCSVHMRSQDAIFGMGNDLPTFSFIQEIVAVSLGVEMGTLHMSVDSFHVYERHFKMLEDIVLDGCRSFQPVETPRMTRCDTSEMLNWDKWQDDAPIGSAFPFISWLKEVSL